MAIPPLATEETEESAKIIQLVEELKTLTLLDTSMGPSIQLDSDTFNYI